MKKSDYIKKYSDIYSNIAGNKRKKADELIDKLADVLLMMDECKEHIEAEGCVTEMCQGNYSIERENPWSKTYDNKAKLMISLIDKLDKMLPDAKQEGIDKAGEALANFITKGKPVELG